MAGWWKYSYSSTASSYILIVMRKLLSYLLIVFLICACGLDELVTDCPAGGAMIEFSASRMRVITKAGDIAEPFSANTSYRLFAVSSPSASWSGESVKFFDVEGLETEDHKVEYSINENGDKASYDVGKALDFYGVTYGSQTPVAVTGTAGTDRPSVILSAVGNAFPDLMYSDNLKSRTSSSGLLTMEFRHALSKLTFEIVKQDETDDTDKKLEDVVLKKVTIRGSGVVGTFDVASGDWMVQASDVADRVFYDAGESSFKIASSVTVVPGEMLVIPNDGQLSVGIVLDGLLDGSDETIEYPLVVQSGVDAEGDPVTEPLRLEPNHEYRFTITVLKNDVRIVTVTPQKYDWIDVDLNGSITTGEDIAYLGQPVYFAGLMWMDRNIGAASSDCENDWYNSIGYYYQHGRNIPYMVDVDAYKADFGKAVSFSFKMISGSGRWNADAICDMRVIYTYDENGNRITTAMFANKPDRSCLYDNLAKNPGEVGKEYSYIMCEADGTESAKRVWAITDFDQTDDTKNENQTYWLSPGNQPCPKGWRLPTKADLYSFMPEDSKLLWDKEYSSGENLVSTGKHKHSEDTQNKGRWDYGWSYFAGKFKVDLDADMSEEFSSPVIDPDGHSRVYGIKFSGENRAYRVMFDKRKSKTDPNRQFVRIYRFDTDVSDEFKTNAGNTEWNLHKFDWEHPAEYMDIPLSGFMHQGGMTEYGTGGILRTSEASARGNNWTLYLRSGSNGVCVTDNTRRTLGENVRCVRDINAK